MSQLPIAQPTVSSQEITHSASLLMRPFRPSIQLGPPPREDVVEIPHAHSRYANFKHRLWFTWYIWHITMSSQGRPPWLAIVCGAEANGGLWFWEDGDEDCLKQFTEDLSLDSSQPGLEMPLECWDDACRTIETHQTRSQPMTSPLVHLAPENRFRIIAWLMIAGPLRKSGRLQGGFSSIDLLIHDWAKSLILLGNAKTCDVCGVSGVLPVWIEVMLEVYMLEELQLISWDRECNCFEHHLTANASSKKCRVTGTPLGKDSILLRMLYELIVPRWPLVHWVAFRTVTDGRPDLPQTFIDLFSGPDQDLLSWDAEDDTELYQAFAKDNVTSTSYPADWNQYMVEIDLQTWLQISDITRIAQRMRRRSDGLKIRLMAVCLRYSSTGMPIAFQNILAPLGITLDHFLFTSMACVVDQNYKERSTLADFESAEFWASPSLAKWLLATSEKLCRSTWDSCQRLSVSERVQAMHVVLNTLPQNLAMYTHSLRLQQLGHCRQSSDFPDFVDQWEWGFLSSLTQYSFNVEFLLGLVKQLVQNDPATNHTISADVYQYMYQDIRAVVARLVLSLRHPKSYKEFLACCGTDAQCLLDLLQDILDLDTFTIVKPLLLKALLRLSRNSGLHPRCFALSELQKVGYQVAAGGFGDIWKGQVSGQTVSVKIMRIFQDSHVEAVIKEFSREALIWRQLCHPNLLPFFGLYHLDNRLCLISPWMENGNVMDFLEKEQANTDRRLSLILDVALGLQYLHKNKVVHGDLKGLNILVTPSGRACISDFGLASIVNAKSLRFTHSTASVQGGTARYQAPELFQEENSTRSHFGSDVYAFALVCYEILTGNVPFCELSNEMAVMMKVAKGYRPSRPLSCSGTPALDSLWELMRNCWQGKAERRPTASQIVARLLSPSILAKVSSTTTEWNDKFTSKFRRSLEVKHLLPSVEQIKRMLFGDETVEGAKNDSQMEIH
ncbi:Protein kinase domain-containing protein [Mycena venus]|uniref:Protein kinase domain-containing protein n=1 Tax=Mycena venus TaxID=2733690 RepID=A0A8H6XLA5_9AGAR|nr:Protein kinase domain-containing protein [Mycena venus]